MSSPSPASASTNVQLSAPSGGVLWALVDYHDLYRSFDQGSTWERRGIPDSLGVRPMASFIDDHQGWMLAPGSPTTQCEEAPAEVWHTIDAGTTWQRLAAGGIVSAQCKNGIWFYDAEHGLISAWDDMHAATIYRTSDGGITWRAAALVPNPPNYQSDTGGAGWQVVWMKSFGADAYLAANGTPYIFKSTDGGATWAWVTKTPTPAVAVVSEERWLDFSNPNQPAESVNGGQQFHPYTTDFTSSGGGTEFAFADAQVGYASGGGLLQRTLDGGAYWTRISMPSSVAPAGTVLSATSSGVVWALDAARHLFRSTDEGKTWEPKAMPSNTGPANVQPLMAFADDRHGWVLVRYAMLATTPSPSVPGECFGQEYQLWRTDDAAATWNLISFAQLSGGSPGAIGEEGCKDSMYFADAQHGLVGVSAGTGQTVVYRSSDGGVTWAAAQLPLPPGFASSGILALRVVVIRAFGSEVRAYAPRYAYGSGDGGATWRFIAETPFAASDLAFITPSRWIELTQPDQSTETTDGGGTWHPFATDHTQATSIAPQVVFADTSVGYATDGGSVQRTQDGGAHWTYITTPGT